jgi:hypothetical protein
MRKTTLFTAAAAALIAAGFGMWAAAPTNATVPTTGEGIDTLQLTMNAKAFRLRSSPTTPSYSCTECLSVWSFARARIGAEWQAPALKSHDGWAGGACFLSLFSGTDVGRIREL